MEGVYDIYLGKEKVGKAQVRRVGLYYRFLCCCDLTGEVICRIMVRCGENVESLGVPIPSGDAFYLEKQLPVSHFRKKKISFFVEPRLTTVRDHWVPVKPDEPFGYLKELKNAVLEVRDGVMGLQIKSTDPVPPGSGPNP